MGNMAQETRQVTENTAAFTHISVQFLSKSFSLPPALGRGGTQEHSEMQILRKWKDEKMFSY